MSFPSKNYGLEPTEKQLMSWTGDAALMFVARLVLIEKYPFIPIKFLMSRINFIIQNDTLTAYCKRKNLPFGCNHLEIKFCELILNNKIDEAKDIILDIINNSHLIKLTDYHQITNGKLNEKIKTDLVNKYKIREQQAEKHNKIKNLNLSFEEKKRLHIELKKESGNLL